MSNVDFLFEALGQRSETTRHILERFESLEKSHSSLRKEVYDLIDKMLLRKYDEDVYLRERLDAVFYRLFPEAHKTQIAFEKWVSEQNQKPTK